MYLVPQIRIHHFQKVLDLDLEVHNVTNTTKSIKSSLIFVTAGRYR
jgi:hypothetical protein